jgi:hypothetical protein
MKKLFLLSFLAFAFGVSFGQVNVVLRGGTDSVNLSSRWHADSIAAVKASASQHPDYVIQKIGSNYYAQPLSSGTAYSGTDFYTVFQAVITQLNDSGYISLGKGVFDLSNEPTINGIGSGFHTLTVRGSGWATVIQQNTSGKNGLVIKNRAGVDIEDLKITCGSSARSALLLDSTGSSSEVSVNQSKFNNLHLISANALYPAFYAKNFWFSNFDNIYAVNLSGDAIWIENASNANTNYGNSTFGKITVDHSTSPGFAGLRIQNGTNTNHGNLDASSFAYWYDVNGGDNSIISTNAFDFRFNYVDIEGFTHPIVLGANGGLSQGFIFLGGAIIVNSGDTAISIPSTTSGGNTFNNIKIIGDATNMPVYDNLTATLNAPNNYNLWLGPNVSSTKSSIAWAFNTNYTTRNKAAGQRNILSGNSYFQPPSFDNGAVLNIDATNNIIPMAVTGSGKTYMHMIVDPGSATYGIGLINGTYLALENAQTPGSRDPQIKISSDSTAGAATIWARWSSDVTKSHSLALRATGDVFLETDKTNNVRIRSNILAATGSVHEMIYGYGADGSVSIGANQNNHYQLEDFGTARWDSTVTYKNLTKDTADFVGSAKALIVDSIGVVHVSTLPTQGLTDNPYTLGLRAMGSSIKASGLVCDQAARATSLFALVSQKTSWFAVYLPKAATLTGVQTIIKTQGSYTGNNYNGVGLYSVSGGTATLVASSTNSATLWTAALGFLQVPFSSTYVAAPGLYYICVLYCSSAETTAPNLGAAASTPLGAYSADFTNSNKLYGIISSLTALPSPTQALSGITASAAAMWVALY